ncbi:kelch repeat [Stylonychia lemnae]|uniref:Kelch repeat n=1 Tax=Stylonychia lemnae TaxID=5949 RepID=A0A078AV15_STYLE|nr:kelch repeat [Stylonychia lemnae]|eukprot:CDW86235.1 kelch repeat [Stylonychia lemnae]
MVESQSDFLRPTLFQQKFENSFNKWERLIALGDTFSARSGHTSILDETNKKIYVFGGYNGSDMLNDVFIFDIEQSSWTEVQYTEEDLITHPRARSSHACCLDTDYKDRFYMYGGTGKNLGQENFNDLWVFEIRTLKFREINQSKINKPSGSYGHSLNYFENALYLFGGTNGFDYYKNLLRFDLLQFQWQKIQVTGLEPEPRYKHCALIQEKQNKLIILGGINQAKRLGNILEFSFDKLQWTLQPLNKNKQFFKGRYGHSTNIVTGDLMDKPYLLIFGGSEDKQKDDLIVYELKSGNFNKQAILDEESAPTSRDFHSSVLFDNQLYIIGGSLLLYCDEQKIFHDLTIIVYDETQSKIIGNLYSNHALIKIKAPSLSRKCTQLDIGIISQHFKSLQDLLKSDQSEKGKELNQIAQNLYRTLNEISDLKLKNQSKQLKAKGKSPYGQVVQNLPKVTLEEQIQVNSNLFTVNPQQKEEEFTNQMIRLYNDSTSYDFTLQSIDNETVQIRVHLFVLVARCDYFKGLIDSGMLETQNFTSKFSLKPGINFDIFKLFLKFIYFDRDAFPTTKQSSIQSQALLTLDETLYLLDLNSFYCLSNDRFKLLCEQRLSGSIDKYNIMQILDMAEKLNAKKIKDIAIDYISSNFDIFSTDAMANQLYQLEKELLIEIIKAKAEKEYNQK